MQTLNFFSCDVQKYGEDFELTGIDKEAKVATFKSGHKVQYDALISTAPLDITLTWLGQQKVADRLEHRYSCRFRHFD